MRSIHEDYLKVGDRVIYWTTGTYDNTSKPIRGTVTLVSGTRIRVKWDSDALYWAGEESFVHRYSIDKERTK